MTFRKVMTYDPRLRRVRLFRFTRDCGRPGDGRGYSEQLTVGLAPRLFGLHRDMDEAIVTVLGLRLHWHRIYGGRFAP